jgi:hypothetical protein
VARLSPENWKSIRTVWEFDPDEPTYNVAAARASEKFKFDAPAKTTIESRAKKEGWERRSNLNGINAAAQRRADKLTNSDGTPSVSDAKTAGISDASDSQKAMASRDESEIKRAEVTARHRSEWKNIGVLIQEAIVLRSTNAEQAMSKAKLAKILAEATAIKQQGERKAWGLDILVDPGSVKGLTDEQLADIVNGKAVA